MTDKLKPSEALFGFASWLTTLEEPVILSARHNAGIAAELVSEFMNANNLEAPRKNWTDYFIPPGSRRLYDMNSDEGSTPETIPDG
jgi:hypothetical protein